MKKGFTLVELLAVIVILGVIALITTPVVMNVVNDSKKSAIVNSIESYLLEASNAIVNASLSNNNFTVPDKCSITKDGNLLCNKIEIKIEVSGRRPTEGILYLSDGEFIYVEGLKYGDNYYSTGFNNEYVVSKYREICKPVTKKTKTTGNVPKGELIPGDEYICEVKPGTEYHFFILSTDEGNVSLILDRNINSDGTLASSAINKTSSAQYNMFEWMSREDYNSYGDTSADYGTAGMNNKPPITLIQYLNNATSDWTNILKLNEVYVDEGNHYGNIVLTGRTRPPKYFELAAPEVGCTLEESSCPLWISNYLQNNENVYGVGLENIEGIIGYWTLSSYSDSYSTAWSVNQASIIVNAYVFRTFIGVRPVITVSNNNLVK